MKKRALVSLVLAVAAAGAVPAGAARNPTYLEKVMIMDAFNIPGRSFSSRCVRIVVSTVDPRWAIVTSPVHTPKACSSGATALHWAHVVDGDGVPCQPPAAVRRDIFKTSTCG